MAETRKFDGSGSEGIQRLVREALGETVRPATPGVIDASGIAEDVAEPMIEVETIADPSTVDYLSFPLES